MRNFSRTLCLSIMLLFVLNNISAANDLLRQLQDASNLQLQKHSVKEAGRSMFNNNVDWENWCGQVDRMHLAQINGLQNILNPQQRMLLGQRQRQMNNWIYRQWLVQKMWMQQNAFGAMPIGGLPWNFRQPQVAYMPIVTWLPQGTHLTANAVVSPDRRHVRMTLNPVFSSVGPVFYYNMNNGAYYRPGAGVRTSAILRPSSDSRSNTGSSNQRPIPAWYRKIRNNP